MYINKINPSNKETIKLVEKTNNDKILEIVSLAKSKFKEWRKISRVKRAEYFDNLAQIIKNKKDIIAKIISKETGKSLNESMAEVVESLHMIQYTFGKGKEPFGQVISSEMQERECYSITKPKGVIAVIAPWNFPFAIASAWTSAPAILEGNVVILKPSEDAPLTGQLIKDLYDEADFPEGVFNLIQGDGETGKFLIKDDQVDHICFTGSVETGKYIRNICANSEHTTCSCEMGSKSAVIVFEDANFDLAINSCLNSAFKLSGQRCVSAGRLLIQRTIFEKFKEQFLEEVKKIKVGDPFLVYQDFCIGPIINESQMHRVMKYNDLVRNDNEANVLYDIKELNTNGYFLNPFVYSVEWSNKSYLKEEVFGPHVALIPFDNEEDAIRIYNDTKYGLSLGCITNDFRRMKKIKEECDAGMIYLNLGSIGAESHLPFGGVKSSGYGGSTAACTFENVVHKIAVTINHGNFNLPQGLK